MLALCYHVVVAAVSEGKKYCGRYSFTYLDLNHIRLIVSEGTKELLDGNADQSDATLGSQV